MKNSNKFRLVAVVLLMAMTNYLCGCSVVGLSVGATIDSHRPDNKIIEKEQVESIKPDTRTTVFTRDGSQKTGKFGGLTEKPSFEKPDNDRDPGLSASEKQIILRHAVNSDSVLYSDYTLKISDEYIDLNDISLIEVPRKKYCKWIGLGAGLAIDAVLIFAAIGISSMDFKIAR